MNGLPVIIQDNGRDITPDNIVDKFLNACDDNKDVASETWCREVYKSTMLYYNPSPNMTIRELFAVQAGMKEKMTIPSHVCVYTPVTDVIPAAKEFLAGKATPDALFANLSFYARPNTLGFYFLNEAVFDEFKAWTAQQVAIIQPMLSPDTMGMFQDFNSNIKLNGLTESILIRANDTDNNEDYSFARLIALCLLMYTQQANPDQYGILPFDAAELYNPKSIVFVNVEKHARASGREIAKEWELINQSTRMKYTILNKNQINRLTAVARSINKIQANAASANGVNHAGRHVPMKFRTTQMTVQDLTKGIVRIISRMTAVAKSENSYKFTKSSFQKPNRRNPDDFNKPGKTISTRYRPDIHIYLDTSGSISERNYEGAIKTCIKLAKKLNINLYFNSFSSVMSTCTKLKLQNKSTKQIYAEFQRVPKVTGGTNFAQIWDYIMRSPKRQREFSLVITDFEYSPPGYHCQHPRNLYYAPISDSDTKYIKLCMESFCKTMLHIDPAIFRKIIQ